MPLARIGTPQSQHAEEQRHFVHFDRQPGLWLVLRVRLDQISNRHQVWRRAQER